MCLSREGLVKLIRYIYNQMHFLPELGILLGGSLTVKNQWELLTGQVLVRTLIFFDNCIENHATAEEPCPELQPKLSVSDFQV